MRVAVLGAGGMGSYAARTAATLEDVSELVVADLDLAAAGRLAAELGPHVRAVRCDVTDPASLDALMAEVHVVLNTVGPFFRFGPPVLEAAIRHQRHYLDIHDDWECTERLFALDAAARDAGITAVVGMGASPGITNLLARMAADALDTVEEIVPGFDLDAAMPEALGDRPAAATVHGLHQLTGSIRLFEDGALRDARPMAPVDFDFPGLGPRRGWTMGHPEALTFPRAFPSLRTCRVVMTTTPSNRLALRALRRLIDAGLLTVERASWLVERLEGVGGPVKGPSDYLRELVDGKRPLPPLFAVARGTKDGRPASVGAAVLSAPATGMGGATGVPLAVGFETVVEQLGRTVGVHAPESVVDPRAFFDRLAPRCSPAKTGADDLVLLSRSWAPMDLRETLAGLL